MATNYPASLDTTTQLPQPSGNNLQSDASFDHAAGHLNASQAIIALEKKVGVGAGSPALNAFLVGTGNGTAAWGTTLNLAQLGTPTLTPAANPNPTGQGVMAYNSATHVVQVGDGGATRNLADTDQAQTFSNKTLTSPQINNGTLGTATIAGGTAKGIQVTTNTLGSAVYSPAVSGTATLDLSTATRHLVNMPNSAGSVTIVVTNPVANQPFIVEVLQGSSGLGTIGWFATIRWSGSSTPIPTATASKKDTFGFITTATTPTFDGYIVGQNL